jgi:DNA alkylation damage repair protein AlkB
VAADESSSTNSGPPDPRLKRKSFFHDDPARILDPKDPAIHKPLSIQRVLERKLRWMTLGGQYNWTDKKYPSGPPPSFPEDIATLLRKMFPDTDAQAAIVNVYSPGDTLSVHRDVSEECDTGLISISFGCDGLFIVGHDSSDGCEIVRLRSGDAVYMTGRSRFAWHGVPKIISSTCPSWLEDWPAVASDTLLQWKGWMSGKRVNLNVRQMKPDSRSNGDNQSS